MPFKRLGVARTRGDESTYGLSPQVCDPNVSIAVDAASLSGLRAGCRDGVKNKELQGLVPYYCSEMTA